MSRKVELIGGPRDGEIHAIPHWQRSLTFAAVEPFKWCGATPSDYPLPPIVTYEYATKPGRSASLLFYVPPTLAPEPHPAHVMPVGDVSFDVEMFTPHPNCRCATIPIPETPVKISRSRILWRVTYRTALLLVGGVALLYAAAWAIDQIRGML